MCVCVCLQQHEVDVKFWCWRADVQGRAGAKHVRKIHHRRTHGCRAVSAGTGRGGDVQIHFTDHGKSPFKAL
eukprot:5740108-Amphidinium_carterae.1